jgi:hypothetical protein
VRKSSFRASRCLTRKKYGRVLSQPGIIKEDVVSLDEGPVALQRTR